MAIEAPLGPTIRTLPPTLEGNLDPVYKYASATRPAGSLGPDRRNVTTPPLPTAARTPKVPEPIGWITWNPNKQANITLDVSRPETSSPALSLREEKSKVTLRERFGKIWRKRKDVIASVGVGLAAATTTIALGLPHSPEATFHAPPTPPGISQVDQKHIGAAEAGPIEPGAAEAPPPIQDEVPQPPVINHHLVTAK